MGFGTKRRHFVVGAVEMGRAAVRRRFAGSYTGAATARRTGRVVGPTARGNSTWTTCVDRRGKTRAWLKRWQKWAGKVQRAVNPDYKHYTLYDDYAGFVANGPQNQPADAIPQAFHLFQFSFNSTYQSYNGASVVFDKYNATSNPFGLDKTVGTQAGGIANMGEITYNEIASFNNDLVSMGITNSTQNPKRLIRSNLRGSLELRNPLAHGCRVVIYKCQRLNDFRYPNEQLACGDYGSGGVYIGTPLEDWAYGMYQKGFNHKSMLCSRSIGMRDSNKFNDNWRIVSQCNTYLPPGGTVVKYMKLGSKTLDIQRMAQNFHVRGEEWWVIKVYPEVQLLAGKPSDPPTYPLPRDIVGLPVNPPSAIAVQYLQDCGNPGVSHVSLICHVSIRRKYVIVPVTENGDVQNQRNTAPFSAPANNGAYIPTQRADVGGFNVGNG